jgi:hypothetical protein
MEVVGVSHDFLTTWSNRWMTKLVPKKKIKTEYRSKNLPNWVAKTVSFQPRENQDKAGALSKLSKF